MTKRADYSIFAIGPGQAFRADYARGRTPMCMSFVSEARDPLEAISQTLERLSADTVAKKALVISTSFWTQLVSLPTAAIRGLANDELLDALKYEAETLSGIEADDAVLAQRELGNRGDNHEFWITVFEKTACGDIQSTLQKNGAKKVIFAHPAGTGISSNGNNSLSRHLEFWNQLAFEFAPGTGQLRAIVHLSGATNRWADELKINGHSIGESTGVVGFSADQQQDTLGDLLQLDSDDHVKVWLNQVATNLAASKLAVPTLEHQKNRSANRTPALLKLMAAVFVIGFCCWHWNWLEGKQQAVVVEFAKLQQPAKTKQKYDRQIAKILEEQTAKQQTAERLEKDSRQIQFLIENQSNRGAQLLKILTQLRTNDLVIEEINSDKSGVMIGGMTLDIDSAPQFATRMREIARSLGWKVGPATQQGNMKLTSGGPWQFKIQLTDIDPERTGATARANANKKVAAKPNAKKDRSDVR